MSEWSPISTGIYDPLKAGSIDATDTEPHDHGIIRAMKAKYKPNKDVVGDPHKTVFVARLNPKTDESTIERVFTKHGVIKRLRLVRDIITGFSRCYAFVEYEEHIGADLACRRANKLEIDGCEIFVDYECERVLKGWIPRRLGGGFGGKKESGQLRFGGKDRPFRKPITDFLINLKQGYDQNYERENTDDARGHQYNNRNTDRGQGQRRYDREKFSDNSRDKKKSHLRERSRERENDSSRDRTYNKRTVERSRDRFRERSWDRKKERNSERTRDQSRDRTRERSRDRTKERRRDRSRERSRDRTRERRRDRTKDQSRERHRDRSRNRQRSERSKDREREGSRNKERNSSADKLIELYSTEVIEASIKSKWDEDTSIYGDKEKDLYNVPPYQEINTSIDNMDKETL